VEDIPKTGSSYVQARMLFNGPQKGTITLTVPSDMCADIASNILGMDLDEELVREDDYDAFKEVLNVICGQVLTSLEGDEVVFDLSVPEVLNLDADAWEILLDNPDVLSFLVDDIPVLLTLKMGDVQH
ncbi:MAG: chemotaxis protein CheX, partial [Bacteroidales bacterium]|nr:chemotaxis protein CheX [Bacteroidales bacterium]